MRVVLSTLNARFSHSSLALRYLRSQLRVNLQDIHDLQILMAEFSINERVDYVLGEIYRMRPDLVGFSVYIWNLEQTLALCGKLKQVMPGIVIVLGGPEVSFDSEEVLKNNPWLDAVVIGEGEETFTEFVHSIVITGVSGIGEVNGLAYRGEGGVMVTPKRALIKNLDNVPSPYQGAGSRAADWGELDNRTVYLEGSRGCPNRCQYCLSSVRPGVRFFSWERVRSDLEALIENGATQVKFVDRTFNCIPERAQIIWGYLIERYQSSEAWRKARFHFEIGADQLTMKNLELLRDAPPGYFEFEIGVQSTNPATQEAIARSMDWERLRRNVATLRGWNNIHLHLDLIAGLPFESYQRFRTSFNDVYRLKPHRLQLGFLKLLKGSGLRESASVYGYRYSPMPPYEVLESGDLDYGANLRLHLIEDMVEKYHNPGRFVSSLGLLEMWADDPMSLYESMADHWEEKGLYRLTHSGVSLYRIMLGFAEGWLGSRNLSHQVPLVIELLKLDCLMQSGIPYLPDCFPHVFYPNQKRMLLAIMKDESNVERFFPEWRALSPRELNKRMLVEFFQYDVVEIAQEIITGSLSRDEITDIEPGLFAVGIKSGVSGKECFRLKIPEEVKP